MILIIYKWANTIHIITYFRYGGVEAALFVLLTTLNKQLEFEQSADVYMFAKLLYMKRPGVFRTKVNSKYIKFLSNFNHICDKGKNFIN